MALMNRDTLKKLFGKGSFPKAINFSDFIDSTVNIVDDGLSKNSEDGLKLAPIGSTETLLIFFENIRDKSPAWNFSLNPEGAFKGLSIQEGGNEGPIRMFFREGGNVGIGTVTPAHKLEVAGNIAMKGRVGTYAVGAVPGNGYWQTIEGLERLDGNHIFEVVAYIAGRKGMNDYALMHAIIAGTFGKRRWKSVKKTQSYRGGFRNKIRIRWHGEPHNYQLQLRTWYNYGLDKDQKPRKIIYRVTRLWDNHIEDQLLQEINEATDETKS